MRAAIDDLRAFLAAEPSPAEKAAARYVLGLCQAGLKQYAEAAATFQGLLADESEVGHRRQGALRAGLGAEVARQGEGSGRRVRATGGAVARQPAGGRGPYHVGEFAYKSGDFKQAAVAYYASLAKAGKTELGEKAAHKLGWGLFPRWTISPMPSRHSPISGPTWPSGPAGRRCGLHGGRMPL